VTPVEGMLRRAGMPATARTLATTIAGPRDTNSSNNIISSRCRGNRSIMGSNISRVTSIPKKQVTSNFASKSKYASNSDSNNASNSRDTSKIKEISNRRQAGNIRAAATVEKPATAGKPATADTPATKMMKIKTATAGMPTKTGMPIKTGEANKNRYAISSRSMCNTVAGFKEQHRQQQYQRSHSSSSIAKFCKNSPFQSPPWLTHGYFVRLNMYIFFL
jgi:hypothetical protein